MGTCALPDMYAQSPRAEGIHIRQSTHAQACYNYYLYILYYTVVNTDHVCVSKEYLINSVILQLIVS